MAQQSSLAFYWNEVMVVFWKKMEQWRIAAHLWRVEMELRMRDVRHLSVALQQERMRNIERLREYRKQGVFPQNLDFCGERVPYFKDAVGTPCAVAYLMKRSGWLGTVNVVARTNNHVYVNDIADGPVLDWIVQSGLTQQEAARVQPVYRDYSVMLYRRSAASILEIIFSIVGCASVAVLLTGVLGVWLLRPHLYTLFKSKKKVFSCIGLMALAAGVGSVFGWWPLLFGATPVEGIFHFSVFSSIVLSVFIILLVVAGKLLKKLFALPVRKCSPGMACVVYPSPLIIASLGYPVLVILTVGWQGSFVTFFDPERILGYGALFIGVSAVSFVLGWFLFHSRFTALLGKNKKKIFSILIVPALGIGGAIVSLFHITDIPSWVSFYEYFFFFYLIPLAVVFGVFGLGILFKKLFLLPIKKKSVKLAYVLYPVVTFLITLLASWFIASMVHSATAF